MFLGANVIPEVELALAANADVGDLVQSVAPSQAFRGPWHLMGAH